MTRSEILLVKRMSEGLVVLEYEGDQAMWTRGRVRGHSKPCALTGKMIQPGEMAFHPVGNQSYRMIRIDAGALTEAVDLVIESLEGET